MFQIFRDDEEGHKRQYRIRYPSPKMPQSKVIGQKQRQPKWNMKT